MKRAALRQHALNLLRLSRKFLSEDGDLDPTAFIITADDQLLRPLELRDESTKIESCAKIVDEAREQKALAIITVFLTRSKDFDGKDFAHDSYSWGDIQNSSSERCILLTLSGPGIKNWAVTLPFKIVKGKIAFRKPIELSEGVDLGLFSDWSEQINGPGVSH